MADTLSEFIRKVEGMFDQVTEQVEEIGKVWQIKVMARLVIETPGPGLQYDLTEYIATGRLRAGWRYSANAPPPKTVSRQKGGPYDIDGQSTRSRISVEVLALPLASIGWVWNDVGYGYYVHEGLGNHEHIGPRKWVDLVALRGEVLLAEARADVMSGGK
ncbi:MAG: hypothetical protein KKA05_10450 [Alphaproteobacteria bacterium]|nr:hypothetical protein [Alphaproteobacteria bacterium]